MASKSNLVLLLSVCMALVGAVTVTGLLTASRTIGSTGSVRAINVEVYWDSGCINVVSEIAWGSLEPGDSATKTIYIKNTGNAALTLNMTCSGWDPSGAEDDITLTWDKEDASVNPDAVVTAVLTLSVSPSISEITNFSLNIIITGTG